MTEPLLVEWQSSNRGRLESQLREGVVVVRYADCEMEILTRCSAPSDYLYSGFTKKRDAERISNSDDLYARIPLGASRLEAKLAETGELNVSMTIVGRYEASTVNFARSELAGDCEGATHFISEVTTGAFGFFAGSSATVGAEATVAGIGAGGESDASRQVLSQDGSESACDAAAEADTAPPSGCGAMIKVRVAEFASEQAAQKRFENPVDLAKHTIVLMNRGDFDGFVKSAAAPKETLLELIRGEYGGDTPDWQEWVNDFRGAFEMMKRRKIQWVEVDHIANETIGEHEVTRMRYRYRVTDPDSGRAETETETMLMVRQDGRYYVYMPMN